jgi:hypothetical protein
VQDIHTNSETASSSARTWLPKLAIAPAWRWAITLFLGYRVLWTVWAAWVSSVYPQTEPEKLIAIWPITTSLGVWLERVVLWPTVRYDVLWNIGIAEQGYAYADGSTAFHPLYPLLISLLGRLLGENYLFASWLIAQVCCVIMLGLLYKLVLLDYDQGVAQRSTLFLLGSPLGFVFLIPYAESLLLSCIVGALYAARLRRWWLAGMLGAGAALTKQPGVIVVVPLVWELWRTYRAAPNVQKLRSLLRPLLGLALAPLGLLAFLVYRVTLGDTGFSWRNPSTLIWALLVTPSYDKVWDHHFGWPWMSLLLAFDRLRTAPYFYLILNTFLMLIMAMIVCYSIMRQRVAYALYSLFLLIMNLSIIYPLLPFISVVRRFTIVFPVFIQLAVWGRSKAICVLILFCNTVLWVYISEAFVRYAYLP